MNCPQHVGVAMRVSEPQRVPRFAKSDLDAETHRCILRCPVAGCAQVAALSEPERVDKRVCSRCGKPVTHMSLADNRCKYCSSHPRGATQQRAKAGWRLRNAKKSGRHSYV